MHINRAKGHGNDIMARLPVPGEDDGTWGSLLNDFLQVAHDASGALLPNTVSSATLQDNSVTNAKLNAGGSSDGQVLTRNSGATGGFTWATLPTAPVSSVAGKTGAVTLVKADVGLGNVDNTSDANKPISTAQQTALNNKTTVADGGGETYFDAGNSGTALTLNLTNGNVQKITLTGNCTLTLTSPASGAYRSLLLYVFQDATGSRTITWPASVKWGTAGAPTLSTAATKMDKILLDTVDGGITWYGSAGPGGF